MSEIQSLARGLKILDALRERNEGVSITELATALDVNKSSVSRLMKTLVQHGYAERATASRGYLAGKKLQEAAFRPRLRDLALPYLHQLVNTTGESAHTAVYSQGKALIIDDVEPDISLKVSGGVGRLEALHCTALGKCLLAFMHLELPQTLPERTHYTLTSKDALERNLELTRKQGYAFDNEENYLGVRCLAVPLYNREGQTIACLGISGPSVRMALERIPDLASSLIDASLELSQTLGFTKEQHV